MSGDKRPGKLTIRAKGKDTVYYPTVFQVMSRNVRGVPLECKLLEDEQSIHLEGGEQFMICYVPEVMLEGEL